MAEQEPMTQEPTRTQDHDPSRHRPGPPAPARPRGWAWFGAPQPGPQLALTWSASGPGGRGRAARHRRHLRRAPKHGPRPARPGVHPVRTRAPWPAHHRWPSTPATRSILNFFASWCEPCQRETPLIARFFRRPPASVTVSASTSTTPARGALNFARHVGVAYPVASDPAADDDDARLRRVRAARDVLPERAAPHREAGDPRGDPDRPADRSSHHDQAERTELTGMGAPTRTDPPWVPIRTSRWPVSPKTPRWLLLVGLVILIGAVLVALVHKPTKSAAGHRPQGVPARHDHRHPVVRGRGPRVAQRAAPGQRGRRTAASTSRTRSRSPGTGRPTARPPTTSCWTTSPSTR